MDIHRLQGLGRAEQPSSRPVSAPRPTEPSRGLTPAPAAIVDEPLVRSAVSRPPAGGGRTASIWFNSRSRSVVTTSRAPSARSARARSEESSAAWAVAACSASVWTRSSSASTSAAPDLLLGDRRRPVRVSRSTANRSCAAEYVSRQIPSTRTVTGSVASGCAPARPRVHSTSLQPR